MQAIQASEAMASRVRETRTNGARLSPLAKAGNGLVLEEGLALAKEKGVVIASNQSIGLGLGELQTYLAIKGAFVCRTGDMGAYAAPGRTFREAAEKLSSLGNGHFLIYTDPKTGNRYLFRVPERYLEQKDALLVVRHPDYSLGTDGKDRIVLATKVGLVEKFPASNGWYVGDPTYDAPYEGETSRTNHATRYLIRIESRVGTIDTDYGKFPFADRRRVLLGIPPSTPLGMVIENP